MAAKAGADQDERGHIDVQERVQELICSAHGAPAAAAQLRKRGGDRDREDRGLGKVARQERRRPVQRLLRGVAGHPAAALGVSAQEGDRELRLLRRFERVGEVEAAACQRTARVPQHGRAAGGGEVLVMVVGQQQLGGQQRTQMQALRGAALGAKGCSLGGASRAARPHNKDSMSPQKLLERASPPALLENGLDAMVT